MNALLGDNIMFVVGLVMIIVGIELINVELYNRSKRQKEKILGKMM